MVSTRRRFTPLLEVGRQRMLWKPKAGIVSRCQESPHNSADNNALRRCVRCHGLAFLRNSPIDHDRTVEKVYWKDSLLPPFGFSALNIQGGTAFAYGWPVVY